MSANEIDLGFQYFAGVLLPDATLQGYAPGGVYRALAPTSTAVPYVIASYQAGTTTTNFRGVRGFVSALYQVKAVGPARLSGMIASAAARIDALITTADPVTITGGIIKSCVQEQPLQLDEEVLKEQWTSLGGLYRLIITAT
jgi:hypothetical protein